MSDSFLLSLNKSLLRNNCMSVPVLRIKNILVSRTSLVPVLIEP